MLLDVMDNLPRCRFTSAQMVLIIHFANQLGAVDVPSLKVLRKIQQNLQLNCGSKPVKTQLHLGNIFYINDIRESISCDMANPLVAPHVHFYPEENTGPISETYQMAQWMEYTPAQLMPMVSCGFKRFWIEELARLSDGTYVIPHTWIVRDGILTPNTTVVTLNPDGQWEHHIKVNKLIEADDFELDYTDIRAEYGETLVWVNAQDVPVMPNAMRSLVDDDKDLFVIMVSLWADDVSGNKFKQYNKHMTMYTGNGCLPGRLLQQEFHIHYVSTSPHASSAEQFATFRNHVQSTEKNLVKCYNTVTKRTCRFILRTPGLPADNHNSPKSAAIWGAMPTSLESDVQYHACHLTGVARNAQEIHESLKGQLRLAMLGDPKPVEEHQQKSGTKNKVTQYWVETLISKAKAMKADNPRRSGTNIASELKTWLDEQPGDKMNPLLDIVGLDSSQDTPVELLHTILLGVMKYIWHLLNTSQWSDTDHHLFAIRLQTADLSGLTVPPLCAGYMIQYKNNLIGKHFKTLMQTLAFHIHSICTPEQFALVKAAGELGALLWAPEIDVMEDYLAQLTTAVANVLDAFDAADPLRILVKIKLHLLAHIPEDVQHLGPLTHSATEIYEAYNGVFRLCSLYSNHLAPSRDISQNFASMDWVKHLLSGGYWWDAPAKQWIQAGNGVQQILVKDPVLQCHLGWTSPGQAKPGLIKPDPTTVLPLEWSQTKASTHWHFRNSPLPGSHWRLGRVLTMQSGDQVKVNSWVLELNSVGETVFGHIQELLVGGKSFVVLEQFVCSQEPHPELDWPILRRLNGVNITEKHITSFLVLPSSLVQFVISVQHDCRKGDCQPTIVRKEYQECEETNRNISLIHHSNNDHFIVNMSALHNSVKLRRALPRSFTQVKLLVADCVAFYKIVSEKARVLQTKGPEANAAAKKREAELAAEAQVVAAAAEAAAAAAEVAAAVGKDLDKSEHKQDPLVLGLGVEPDSDISEEDLDDDEDNYLPPGAPARKQTRKRKRPRHQ
ncbi:hypothetical protein DFH08DRAFT_913107 [Mycena albidolilacea]|uniref:Uncharacterized protein n=1 Tax=Mycena albidolilacea TaxID=1033008 RepID=A0AAD7EVQ1_9AGAR|nr:hypothetical protein DFH08DRAFT_913107 [Mycena albidolilacea]